MAQITINGVSFDPATEGMTFEAAGLASADASSSDYVLIQTAAPLTPAQKTELAGLGVVINEYVSDNTYLCTYKPTDLSRIRALPYVTWTNVYMQGFKVAPNLRSSGVGAGSQIVPMAAADSHSNLPKTVDIVFHDDVDTSSDALRQAVSDAAHVDKDELPKGGRKVRLTVQEKFLDDIARIDAVRVIQQVPVVGLRNTVARTILNADVVLNGTAFEGAGEIVCVADTGFDQGSASGAHPAFIGRVTKLYDLGRPGKFNDPHGHGTHVCGSVLGDGGSTTMEGKIRGTAPKARLVVQSLIGPGGGLSGIPFDLTDLFEKPYAVDGARVHTNSWGSTTPGLPYDQSSREIDEFVWDHPDLVVCFAAGNDGIDADGDGVVDPAQIGSEAAAKNCITVGASESLRPLVNASRPTYGSLRPGSFPKNPIHDDPMADHAEGMAAFSSRGPTQERRFKPDVVAPGTSILSAHSRSAPPAGATFGTSSDPDYFFDTGTSMATPLVAGCAAVIRETLVKNGTPTPPAALVKALLINGAVEVPGQYSPSEAGPSFNINSGFGRVDLHGSVVVPGPTADFGIGDALEQDDEKTFTVEIPADSDFKITLVWSDPPGSLLQNDLDLIVTAADGTERHGNMGTSPGFDRTNNVEQVVWTSMPPGRATVTVRAFQITRFAQPYAYAWRLS